MLTQHPAFNHLRRAFVFPRASRRREVAATLNDRGHEGFMPLIAFLTDDERADVGADDPTMQPLIKDIFPYYLDAISTTSAYWPSTIEVIAIANALRA